MSPRDGMHYFRIESVDLVQRLESGLIGYADGACTVDELFRWAHTLKGAARAVQRDGIADLSHSLEDVLAHHRETGEPLTPRAVGELLALMDAVRKDLSTETRATDDADADEENRAPRTLGDAALRIRVEELEALSGGVQEIEAHAADLRAAVYDAAAARSLAQKLVELARSAADMGTLTSPRLLAGLDELTASLGEHVRGLRATTDHIEIEVKQVAQRAFELRLVALEEILPELERTLHDACVAGGKSARLEARGMEIGIDAQVLAPLRAALVHLVRNAVAHGIELPGERRAAGKPDAGLVTVRVDRRGGRIGVTVADDGRGLDRGAIAIAARGRADATAARAEELIFLPGLSTAASVSEIAGRGVGLDAVRSAIGDCKGSVRVDAADGRGTSFEIEVPVSLSAMRALLVEADERTVLIPLDFVRATRLLAAGEIVSDGLSSTIVHEGRTIPLRALSAVVETAGERETPRVVVVLRTSRGEVALGVTSLAGTRDVVVRPFPGALGKIGRFAGASFDRGGIPRLVLDPEGLHAGSSFIVKSSNAAIRGKPVLVIDDSLTTRMLEQSILEAVGYQVDVASSAEEGLEKASRREYGLFVCDVEMPGMNGYEFTRVTRDRPDLASTPVIMVTSLDSEESRRRGREAGVSAYIVKGEFDQSTFLRAVAELGR